MCRFVAVLAACAVLLAGCGATNHPSNPVSAAGGGTQLYASGDWAVVAKGGHAVALHRSGGAWHPDRSGVVKVEFLGPRSPAPRLPQVAAELSAKSALAESALWVDGVELLEKGGGLSPTRGTIYGAPAAELAPGTHVAVAYARTAAAATAVATTFVVR